MHKNTNLGGGIPTGQENVAPPKLAFAAQIQKREPAPKRASLQALGQQRRMELLAKPGSAACNMAKPAMPPYDARITKQCSLAEITEHAQELIRRIDSEDDFYTCTLVLGVNPAAQGEAITKWTDAELLALLQPFAERAQSMPDKPLSPLAIVAPNQAIKCESIELGEAMKALPICNISLRGNPIEWGRDNVLRAVMHHNLHISRPEFFKVDPPESSASKEEHARYKGVIDKIGKNLKAAYEETGRTPTEGLRASFAR